MCYLIGIDHVFARGLGEYKLGLPLGRTGNFYGLRPGFGLPQSRSLGDALFELRPRGKSGIGRAFYCFVIGRRVMVLHAFVKQSQQTPDRELKLARKRLKEMRNG